MPTFDMKLGDVLDSIEVNGLLRSYRLHIPTALDDSKPAPLVFVLHGGGGNSWNAHRVTRFSRAADAHGFIVCYPEGTGSELFRLTWNAGYCCGYASDNKIDDVAFFEVLTSHLKSTLRIDSRAIYAAGISNGGMMALRLAVEMSDTFAAVASVAGAQPPLETEPLEPVGVVLIHGTHDEYVPYNGGFGVKANRPDVSHASVGDTVRYWVKHNGCNPAPKHEIPAGTGTFKGLGRMSLLDKLSSGEFPSVVCERFTGGKNDTEVRLYTVNGGLHAWHGGERGWRDGDEPLTTFDATEAIWRFFSDKR
jgi:polyhydroxybutyrate depolymerase